MGMQCIQNTNTCLKKHCLQERDHTTLLCFNSTREVFLGDQPTAMDDWGWCRFLFLKLLSIRDVSEAASLALLQVSHGPGELLPLEKKQQGAPSNHHATFSPVVSY